MRGSLTNSGVGAGVIEKDITDVEGRLWFPFTSDIAKSFLKDSKLKLYFRVFLGELLLLESEKTHAQWKAAEFILEVSLKSDRRLQAPRRRRLRARQPAASGPQLHPTGAA